MENLYNGSFKKMFDDKERFHLDDVEFCIMPRGRVLMYHNAFQKIHNILIEYPLLGKVTDEYNQVISDYLQEKRIDVKKYRNESTPSLDTIDNYLKRYDYKVSFASENSSLLSKATEKYFCPSLSGYGVKIFPNNS